jgi:hypothetical protein
MTSHPASWTTCPVHGKRSWPTRKAARHTLRAHHPDSGMQVYQCVHKHGWHIGNPHGGERAAEPRKLARDDQYRQPHEAISPERREAAVRVLAVLITREPDDPINQYDLTELIGWDRNSYGDTRNVRAGLRYLRRRGLAEPLDYGYVASAVAYEVAEMQMQEAVS